MYELTGSAWDLGLVSLYQFLPALSCVAALWLKGFPELAQRDCMTEAAPRPNA